MTRQWLASGISAMPTRNTGPQNRGFDHFYGNLVGEVDYFTKERGGIVDWQRDGKFLKEDGYYTDLIGNEAVSIIDHHDTSKPRFFMWRRLRRTRPIKRRRTDVDAYKKLAGDEGPAHLRGRP